MFKCKYCGKEFESKQKLGGHIIWCKDNPNRNGKSNFNKKLEKSYDYDLFCQYCGKQCKNLNSLKQHEIRCKENPNRIKLSPICKCNYSHVAWNKGLTKDIDERVRKNGESISNGYKTGRIKTWSDGLTKESDVRLQSLSQKVSKTILNKVKNDEWHNSFGKSRIVIYNGIEFHGHWEVKFAKYLDMLQIEWKRNTDKFEYFFDGKVRYYTPDFYIPKNDLYIEIKGYPTKKDFCKWDLFPKDKKLNIYFGDDLYNLGIIEDYKDVYRDVSPKYRFKYILK